MIALPACIVPLVCSSQLQGSPSCLLNGAASNLGRMPYTTSTEPNSAVKSNCGGTVFWELLGSFSIPTEDLARRQGDGLG